MAVKIKSPARLSHVVLKTNDLQPMIHFWKTVLGAEVKFENPMSAFISYDKEHHRVAILHLPSKTPRTVAMSSLDHVSFTFETIKDLANAYLQRKEAGIMPKWCVNHGPTTSMYYEDPDRNKVEFQVENFDTSEEAMEFMGSKAFMENFIGTDFDPEELVRRVESGESEASIKKRIEIGLRGIPEGYGES